MAARGGSAFGAALVSWLTMQQREDACISAIFKA